jgi:formate hydrogenlyase subunit 3/multisubunit Na+/H+ antiporter MnhD subunit
MASFAMGYAMQNLGWKFYIINASYNFIFLAAVFLLWPETKGLTLEEISVKFEGPSAVLYGGSGTLSTDIENATIGSKEAKESTRSV